VSGITTSHYKHLILYIIVFAITIGSQLQAIAGMHIDSLGLEVFFNEMLDRMCLVEVERSPKPVASWYEDFIEVSVF
jgi:hypothetical protein